MVTLAASGTDPFAGRPVAVVADLAQLEPRNTGRTGLPLHLDGSARTTWDLSQPWARREIAQTVLTEADDPADVVRYVDRDTLTRGWADVILPRRIRDAWETAHPELAAVGTAASSTAIPEPAR